MLTPENVCIRVISLPHDERRLRGFVRDLERTDLAAVRDFRAETAVNGKRMHEDELRRVTTENGFRDIVETERMGSRNFHYQLSRGAVGCYLSHLNVLRSLAMQRKKEEEEEEEGSRPEYVVVFEDDARFWTGEGGEVADKDSDNGVLLRILEHANNAVRAYEEEEEEEEEGQGQGQGSDRRQWDILMLGCLPVKYDDIVSRSPGSTARVLRLARFFGTHAMVIPLRSASRLVRLLGDGGAISQQIDSALSDLAERGDIRVLAPERSILVQEHFDLANPEQSNIQLPLVPDAGGRDPASPMPPPLLPEAEAEARRR